MPKPGQKSVTLKEETYDLAERNAKKHNKSVAGFVTDLIEEKTKRAVGSTAETEEASG